MSRTRVALTTFGLEVPPKYYVLQHATHLPQIDFHAFASCVRVLNDLPSNIEVTAFASRNSMSRAAQASGWRAFSAGQINAIRNWRPDLVHHHFLEFAGPGLHATGGSVPHLTTVHGANQFVASAKGLTHRLMHGDVWRTVKSTDMLLFVSEYLQKWAIAKGFPAQKSEVHYQGVDTEYFKPSSQAASTGLPNLVYVGNLSELKGVPDLMRMSSILSKKIPHTLTVVGDGPLSATVSKYAEAHYHCQMLGSLDRGQIRDVLQRATAFVFPSRPYQGRAEAAGLVLLEAQATGVPVFAYPSGGIPEMMIDDVTGNLTTDPSPAELAGRVANFLRLRSEERRAVSVAARDFVVAERSSTQAALKLSVIYDRLIQERRQS